jgi:hypothetical protein
MIDGERRKLDEKRRGVRPHWVLVRLTLFTIPRPPGAQSERRRQKRQIGGGDLPQCRKDLNDAQALGKSRERRFATFEKLREDPLEQVQ